MKKRVWIAIGVGFVILMIGVFIGMQFQLKPKPIMYTQKLEDNYNVIYQNDREYVSYSAISPQDRGGYTGIKREENAFSAVIEDISKYQQNMNVLVKSNDTKYRGTYTFSLEKDTILEWKSMIINQSQLKVGQTISIYSVGGASESAPAHLAHVDKVVVLDDEI